MLKNNLGYPRIGDQRQLKKASENYWAGKISEQELKNVGAEIRKTNWNLQKEAGICLIPSNDFSFYDQVLDTTVLLGAIPERYQSIKRKGLDLYFAMARGLQTDQVDVSAMEMTKWFDTNYHYIVPEFVKDQTFQLNSEKIISEFREAKEAGIHTKPVIIGPVTYLLLGKEKEAGFDRLDLLSKLLPIYSELFIQLEKEGADWIQVDEPFLALDITNNAKIAFKQAYNYFSKENPKLKFLLSTYFEGVEENLGIFADLPVAGFHIDLVRAPQQLDKVLQVLPANKYLSLGVIDGRNIWINDYEKSLIQLEKAISKLGEDKVMIAPSCSLLHSPCDLENEDRSKLGEDLFLWLSFAKQKLGEVEQLFQIQAEGRKTLLARNQEAVEKRRTSEIIHKQAVKHRVNALKLEDGDRLSAFPVRQQIQQKKLKLPLLPTTTIGSFPQTPEVRKARADFKKGALSENDYRSKVEKYTADCIHIQEEIGLDVLVHGEFERNDMVEYFGEQLDGFAFTKNGWVQSYGTRCVKPPVIYGDVSRPEPMTVEWSTFAQSITNNYVKGMLTGPVTILQWSFVRDDQPRKDTCLQIALAILDEVKDLEAAGINIIQVDEPAIREGLPLKKAKQAEYLDWSVFAFKVSTADVQDETQIHTHMCYSEFNDIIKDIARMDADVITIETSRSQMELLDAFENFNYPNEIGPGVYDIHSPRIPDVGEIKFLLDKAAEKIPVRNLWVNPDCGLKTRAWKETKQALINMVNAASEERKKYQNELVK